MGCLGLAWPAGRGAVRAACGRAGGAARWIGLGPLSNLAALLSRDPELAQRLFIT